MDENRVKRAELIEAFAERLRQIRLDAGKPSYRAMAAKSGIIAHTTLYEAAAGHRLPSWETTAEFLRSCDVEPDVLRDEWEATSTALLKTRGGGQIAAVAHAAEAGATSTATAKPPEATPAVEAANQPNAAAEKQPRRNPGARWLAVAVVFVVALLGTGVATWLMRHRDEPPPLTVGTKKDCPLIPKDPPPAPPATKGDSALFLGDVTYPDCTHVKRGAIFTKQWRLRNTGKVTWRGYYFERVEEQTSASCRTVDRIDLPETRPDRTIDVKVAVTAPNTPSFCIGRFKLKAADGRDAFPAGRPVNFQIIVD